jgi:hypothetical protein
VLLQTGWFTAARRNNVWSSCAVLWGDMCISKQLLFLLLLLLPAAAAASCWQLLLVHLMIW